MKVKELKMLLEDRGVKWCVSTRPSTPELTPTPTYEHTQCMPPVLTPRLPLAPRMCRVALVRWA